MQLSLTRQQVLDLVAAANVAKWHAVALAQEAKRDRRQAQAARMFERSQVYAELATALSLKLDPETLSIYRG